MDIFTYVNSKFVYVERHIRTEMTRLYRDVMLQRCTLEREVFKNTLALATHAPDEFAFQLMKRPGYTTVIKLKGEFYYYFQNPYLLFQTYFVSFEVIPFHRDTLMPTNFPIIKTLGKVLLRNSLSEPSAIRFLSPQSSQNGVPGAVP